MAADNSKNAPGSGPLIGRLTIILYAIAIVMIGLHPIRKQYGSFFNFIKRESRALVYRADTLVKEAKSAKNAEDRSLAGRKSRKNQNLDRLTHKDRRQLDNLLDKM